MGEVGVKFLAFLYRGLNFGHFLYRGSKQENLLYRGVPKMFFLYGGLENAFFCIGGLENAILLYQVPPKKGPLRRRSYFQNIHACVNPIILSVGKTCRIFHKKL